MSGLTDLVFQMGDNLGPKGSHRVTLFNKCAANFDHPNTSHVSLWATKGAGLPIVDLQLLPADSTPLPGYIQVTLPNGGTAPNLPRLFFLREAAGDSKNASEAAECTSAPIVGMLASYSPDEEEGTRDSGLERLPLPIPTSGGQQVWLWLQRGSHGTDAATSTPVHQLAKSLSAPPPTLQPLNTSSAGSAQQRHVVGQDVHVLLCKWHGDSIWVKERIVAVRSGVGSPTQAAWAITQISMHCPHRFVQPLMTDQSQTVWPPADLSLTKSKLLSLVRDLQLQPSQLDPHADSRVFKLILPWVCKSVQQRLLQAPYLQAVHESPDFQAFVRLAFQRFVRSRQHWRNLDPARIYLFVALLCAPNSTAVRTIVGQFFEPEGLAHTCAAKFDSMPQDVTLLLAVSDALRIAQAMSNPVVEVHRQQILGFAHSLVLRVHRWFQAASEAQVKALPPALIAHVANQCCQLGRAHGDALSALAESCFIPALQCNVATEDLQIRSRCVETFAFLLQCHPKSRIAHWIASPECLQLLLCSARESTAHRVSPTFLQDMMPRLLKFISILAELREDHFALLLAVMKSGDQELRSAALALVAHLLKAPTEPQATVAARCAATIMSFLAKLEDDQHDENTVALMTCVGTHAPVESCHAPIRALCQVAAAGIVPASRAARDAVQALVRDAAQNRITSMAEAIMSQFTAEGSRQQKALCLDMMHVCLARAWQLQPKVEAVWTLLATDEMIDAILKQFETSEPLESLENQCCLLCKLLVHSDTQGKLNSSHLTRLLAFARSSLQSDAGGLVLKHALHTVQAVSSTCTRLQVFVKHVCTNQFPVQCWSMATLPWFLDLFWCVNVDQGKCKLVDRLLRVSSDSLIGLSRLWEILFTTDDTQVAAKLQQLVCGLVYNPTGDLQRSFAGQAMHRCRNALLQPQTRLCGLRVLHSLELEDIQRNSSNRVLSVSQDLLDAIVHCLHEQPTPETMLASELLTMMGATIASESYSPQLPWCQRVFTLQSVAVLDPDDVCDIVCRLREMLACVPAISVDHEFWTVQALKLVSGCLASAGTDRKVAETLVRSTLGLGDVPGVTAPMRLAISRVLVTEAVVVSRYARLWAPDTPDGVGVTLRNMLWATATCSPEEQMQPLLQALMETPETLGQYLMIMVLEWSAACDAAVALPPHVCGMVLSFAAQVMEHVGSALTDTAWGKTLCLAAQRRFEQLDLTSSSAAAGLQVAIAMRMLAISYGKSTTATKTRLHKGIAHRLIAALLPSLSEAQDAGRVFVADLPADAAASGYKLLASMVANSERKRVEVLSAMRRVQASLESLAAGAECLKRLRLAPFAGLRNLAATCYMNATLQQLFMTRSFPERLLQVPVPATEQLGTGNLVAELQTLFVRMKFTLQRECDTSAFCKSVRDWENAPLNPYMQRDASEFMAMLFQQLEAAIAGTAEAKLVEDTFGGTFCNKLTAEGQSSESFEPFTYVSLPVKGVSNVRDALHELFAPQDVQYTWDNVGALPSQRRTYFHSLPPHLILHLKRFEFQNGSQAKVFSRFEFPHDIDLAPFFHAGSDAGATRDAVYALSGVVVHLGTADAGHYYSLIRDRLSGTWYRFNDTRVTVFDLNQLDSEAFGNNGCPCAFLLFYDRKAEAAVTPEWAVTPAQQASLQRLVPEADMSLCNAVASRWLEATLVNPDLCELLFTCVCCECGSNSATNKFLPALLQFATYVEQAAEVATDESQCSVEKWGQRLTEAFAANAEAVGQLLAYVASSACWDASHDLVLQVAAECCGTLELDLGTPDSAGSTFLDALQSLLQSECMADTHRLAELLEFVQCLLDSSKAWEAFAASRGWLDSILKAMVRAFKSGPVVWRDVDTHCSVLQLVVGLTMYCKPLAVDSIPDACPVDGVLRTLYAEEATSVLSAAELEVWETTMMDAVAQLCDWSLHCTALRALRQVFWGAFTCELKSVVRIAWQKFLVRITVAMTAEKSSWMVHRNLLHVHVLFIAMQDLPRETSDARLSVVLGCLLQHARSEQMIAAVVHLARTTAAVRHWFATTAAARQHLEGAMASSPHSPARQVLMSNIWRLHVVDAQLVPDWYDPSCGTPFAQRVWMPQVIDRLITDTDAKAVVSKFLNLQDGDVTRRLLYIKEYDEDSQMHKTVKDEVLDLSCLDVKWDVSPVGPFPKRRVMVARRPMSPALRRRGMFDSLDCTQMVSSVPPEDDDADDRAIVWIRDSPPCGW